MVAEPAPENGKPTIASRARILGFIVAQATRQGVGHILTIDVPPSSQRFGIGSKLLRLRCDRGGDACYELSARVT